MWVSENEGARRLQMGRQRFKRIALATGVKRQALPGEWVRYWGPDIDRVAREAIIEPDRTQAVAS